MNGYLILGLFVFITSLLVTTLDVVTGVKTSGPVFWIAVSHTLRNMIGAGILAIWYVFIYHKG